MTNQIKQFLTEAKEEPEKFYKVKSFAWKYFTLELSETLGLRLLDDSYRDGGDMLRDSSTDPDLINKFNSLFNDSIQDKVKEIIEEIQKVMTYPSIPSNQVFVEYKDAIDIIKKHLLKGNE